MTPGVWQADNAKTAPLARPLGIEVGGGYLILRQEVLPEHEARQKDHAMKPA